MRFVKPIILVVLFLCGASPVSAQLVINEFSSGTTSDWVELYNTSTDAADLSKFRLEDANGNGKNKRLEGTVAGGGLVTISFSNWLNNGGDSINLYFSGNTDPIDSIGYGAGTDICIPDGNQSIGSQPDGSGNIVRFANPSKDQSNNKADTDPCTTPTPVPTKVPSSTKKPSPTTKPTPTSTPLPIQTPDITETPTTTSTVSPTDKKFGREVSNSQDTDSESVRMSDIPLVYDATPSSHSTVAGAVTGRQGYFEVIFALIVGAIITSCASLLLALRKFSPDTIRQILRRVR